jgi:vacuolar-type H+-ATPase subunit H
MVHDTRRHENYDILDLIDRLESQVTEGKRVLLSNRVIVEEGEFLALLDQLRDAVPVEIQHARRVLQDRQKIVLDAQAEAEKIIMTAKERAEYLISEKGLTAEARYRGEDYLRQGKETSRKLMSEVDQYASDLLNKVESVMRDNLKDIETAKMRIAGHAPHVNHAVHASSLGHSGQR